MAVLPLGKGVHQVVQALFGHKATHAQHILATGDAQLGKIARSITHLGSRHAIVDEMHTLGAAILAPHDVAYDLGDNYHLVGTGAPQAFAQAQHYLGQ